MIRTAILFLIALALCVLLSIVSPAQESAPWPFAGRDSMTGYSLEHFKGFQKDWHFVTVRYRKDTGEMRWTYANDLAWKALVAGGTHYPDGSVFAKIGLATQEDPDFISSAVPSGARRFQLMVKDAKKHAETDGWGYALFDQSGRTFGEDPEDQVMACHACHAVVPHRDYVFSQPVNLEIDMAAFGRMKEALPENLSGLVFETVSIDELSNKVRGILPPGVKEIRLLQGDMRKHIFQGTIDEIRPMLAQEALRSKLPAALMSEKGDRLSLVLPEHKKGEGCSAPEGFKPVTLTAHYTTTPDGSETYPLTVLEFCDAVPLDEQ
jgi:hypothetical protein